MPVLITLQRRHRSSRASPKDQEDLGRLRKGWPAVFTRGPLDSLGAKAAARSLGTLAAPDDPGLSVRGRLWMGGTGGVPQVESAEGTSGCLAGGVLGSDMVCCG